MRTCQECGIIIKFKGGNHCYCVKCRNKARKKDIKVALERYHEKHTHYCANCRKPLKNYKNYFIPHPYYFLLFRAEVFKPVTFYFCVTLFKGVTKNVNSSSFKCFITCNI